MRCCTGLLLALVLVGCGHPESARRVTFNRDIAPIVYDKCANCHRPGEAAPFALLAFDDVRKRATQIVDVTASRYMPPWPPGHESGPFMDDRSLTDAQIALIAQWVEQGMTEGDAADLPPTPTWTDGWHLGEPDLVLELKDPYMVPAEGEDVFRNFALRVPIHEPRMVKAVEFRPSNRQVMHHAVIQVDTTGWSRMEDRRDPQPGFDAMFAGQAGAPDGFFQGWTPGRMPFRGYDDMGWPLSPGSDIVINAHLLPTGKPEPFGFMIGIHFQDNPVVKQPKMIRIGREYIDIAPGDSAYPVEADYKLPVDVRVLSVVPHAHYTGKQVSCYATLPDGSRRALIEIADWDFNWQDEYRFVEPVYLPRGTVVSARFVFDNSADNDRNPVRPVQRVVFGARSTDEMANVHLKVLTASPRDLLVLRQYDQQHEAQLTLKDCEKMLAATPDDPRRKLVLASRYLQAGRVNEAVALIEQVLRDDPKAIHALTMMAGLLRMQNRFAESASYMQRAIEIDPTDPYQLAGLGETYTMLEQYDKAVAACTKALKIYPDLQLGHYYLASALAKRGAIDASLQHYERAAALAPRDARIRVEYAQALRTAGRPADAIDQCRRAIDLTPRWPAPRILLGTILAASPDPAVRNPDEAIKVLQIPGQLHPTHLDALAMAYAAAGRFDDAVKAVDHAIQGANKAGLKAFAAQLRERREHYLSAKPYIGAQ